ncbi:NAD-dependent epimerase/dehydratase family protein [Streptomyces litchfieldiae]|uniref:NAD-dependent epimerase/dehydratase family protein n=1 Tax=Streptomyces litchfieldiae TaxID=3075543 RepID=A0ABU2MP98_9ACTN|nr:NAD-dependent epimerase/dehydratase family protein [Streptomyces sp. DSM 44938]MDT0343442.1 NAD-dependent epimerase/dehydratase family protein [Streptomyces sp. DSM 44938]
MGKTVLVTGAARQLSGRFVRHIQRDRDVSRVIGVDRRPPAHPLGGAEFIRADIRQPSIVTVLAEHAVDTVVHLDVHGTPGPAGGGRSAVKEVNVLGTLQLLGACQKVPGLSRVVIKSSTQIYGTAGRDPAVFSETTMLRAPAGGGFPRDVVEIEGYVRGFARRCPDVRVTVLRFAHVLGPAADSRLAAYFRLPVLPTVLGYDPRLQFVHEDDVLEVLTRAVADPELPGALGGGTFNVAGDGVLLLSQAARRIGRPTMPVVRSFAPWLGSALGALGVDGVSAEQLRSLVHGRVVRTSRLREAMGGPLAYTTPETFADFAAVHGPGLLPPEAVTRAVDRIEEVLRHG